MADDKPTVVERQSSGWLGWVYFAGIMMMLAGVFQAIAGLAALFKDRVYLVGASGLLVFNYRGWGWIHLILGIVLFLSAFSVFAGGGWGRFLGTLLAGLSAISAFAFFPAYPLWAMVVIIVDIFVIYALLVHGGEARADVGG